MGQHTPGPWNATRCTVRTEDGKQVALCNGYIHGSEDDVTPFANAKLIAAAPKMQDALREVVSLIEAWQAGIFRKLGIRWEEDPPALKSAREALAASEDVETEIAR